VPSGSGQALKKIAAAFYRTPAGNEPVREWLKALSPEDRREIGEDIGSVEYGWPVGMPVSRPLDEGDRAVKTRTPKKAGIGSAVDEFLKDEGTYEATQGVAVKRVLAWQIEATMKKLHLTKAEMARRMETSRSQLDRLLDPDSNAVTLDTLTRAARAIGRQVKLELV